MGKNDDKKKANKKVERKKAVPKKPRRQSNDSDEAPPNRTSKYVGVHMDKTNKWIAQIRIGGDTKHLGSYHDETEAARVFDVQAALLGRPVNFPQHEGQKQAKKSVKNLSQAPHVTRPSKYVGVNWSKWMRKWEASIKTGKKKDHLGYFQDEKEAARTYDEQAALLGRPVNFPLHEGMVQAAKPVKNKFKQQDVNRPSKYVGLTWHRRMKRWEARIRVHGKTKNLGYYEDEKEAARAFDEQAALHGRPMNFPLHEGQKQAKKGAWKGVQSQDS